MSATLLTLGRLRHAQLSQAHSAYLSAVIDRYRQKAERALKLARTAWRHGNEPLAAGLLDESATYLAMAQGLTQQQSDTNVTGETP